MPCLLTQAGVFGSGIFRQSTVKPAVPIVGAPQPLAPFQPSYSMGVLKGFTNDGKTRIQLQMPDFMFNLVGNCVPDETTGEQLVHTLANFFLGNITKSAAKDFYGYMITSASAGVRPSNLDSLASAVGHCLVLVEGLAKGHAIMDSQPTSSQQSMQHFSA